MAPDGSRLYAGGAFATVDGGDHRRLVALDPTSGNPITAFDADVSGGSVRSIVARGNDLYLGGNFATVEGSTRTRLARVDAASGAVDPGWAPVAAGGSVFTLEIPTDGSRVYVGGRFDSIGGEPGMTGSPAAIAAVRALTLSPTFDNTEAGGPTKAMPASVTASAKSARSERNPYPGWIASAP